MIIQLLRWIVLVPGAFAILATLLPFLPGNERWIRVWDFPRVQLTIILAIVLASVPLILSLRQRSTLLFMILLGGCLLWQLHQIRPFTPFASRQAMSVSACQSDSEIRLLVSNVLMENREASRLLALVREVRPHLVLLVETDSWWENELNLLRDDFPHVIGRAQDDTYGIHLFSQFPMIDPKIRFLLEDYVPSIKTGLELPTGKRIDFYGVHPKPPPLEDTERRDAELLMVGREVRQGTASAIVAGDLNDVAWSRTTRLFQEVSGLLDPRIGRGLHMTFHADWPLLRWPLDHVFFDESFWLVEIAVMPHVGSDHFPLFISLCIDPSARQLQRKPEPEPSDLEEAEEAIREGQSKN